MEVLNIKLTKDSYVKEFIENFNPLRKTHGSHEAWRDFLLLAGYSISQACDFREDREKQWLQTAKHYTADELNRISYLLACVVNALEENPEQDFLGTICMLEKLGDDYIGQYFTPYNLAQTMAPLVLSNSTVKNTEEEEVQEEKPWMSIGDPTCGSGATLIAAANYRKNCKTNWQLNTLFVGTDLNFKAAMMCYIQISLLGCAGYVHITDALIKPLTGHVLFPPRQALCTPMFFHEVWYFRRWLEQMKALKQHPLKTA